MASPTTFSNITSLVVEGAGDITISETGELTGAMKATQRGSALHVEGMGGGSYFGNGMSFLGSMFGMGNNVISQSSGGGSCSISQSNGCVSISCAPGMKLVVNGKTINWESASSTATPAPPPPTYRLDAATCSIQEISVTSSANLHSLPFGLCASSMSVRVRGSGNVTLPSGTFENLNLEDAGSGNITGASTSTTTIAATVRGSGNIARVHVLGSGTACVHGSGDISLTAVRVASVRTNVTGSGDIRIKAR